MPYEKVLVTHKFGIISQSHKRQLQERLILKRKQIENEAKKHKNHDEIINLQITEEFVKIYNEATNEKKSKLDHQCFQMFEKIKKKLYSHTTDDLNIQLAWAELSQLCQCNSPIQEDCMDLFILSMEYTRLSFSQIPTLFFLAETVLYWIRTDIITQPFLRAFELKLLKVGQLIFERIFYHMLEGNLNNQDDLKEHLSIYLHGFEELQNAYSPYPDALLYMSFMISIGSLISNSINFKDNSNLFKSEQAKSDIITNDTNQKILLPNFQNKTNSENVSNNIFIFNINSILKNSILLHNYLVKKKSDELLDYYLNNIMESIVTIDNQNWIETAYAFYILGECAKLNIKALNTFLYISRGTYPTINTNKNTKDDSISTSSLNENGGIKDSKIETWKWELACLYVEILADICINSPQASIKKKSLFGFHKDIDEAFKSKSFRVNTNGYGILDTARFQLNFNEDWSWRVRYTSIKALVHICKSLYEKEWEELRQLCWSFLIIFQDTETNHNVLEALKVGQISNKIKEQNSIKKNGLIQILKTKINDENIFSQMGQNMFTYFREESYINQNKFYSQNKIQFKPNNVESNSKTNFEKCNLFNGKSTQNTDSIINKPMQNSDKEAIHKINRTTLKEEITINNQFRTTVPNYFDRKNFDLMRIVEDQYRKEENEKFEKHINDKN